MTMQPGERQVAPTLDGIRRDHRARYEFAARVVAPGSMVIDFACGVGYGCKILADAGHRAHGYDNSEEAIEYARTHYGGERATFHVVDAREPVALPDADAAVCFETIEHVADPRPLLRALREASKQLIASVPNEDGFPYSGEDFHYRHYTRAEFEALLEECGWEASAWLWQAGPESDVGTTDGTAERARTLVAVACRGEIRAPRAPVAAAPRKKRVAILGLGPSARQYLELTKRLGGRSALFDEVWTINALGDVFASDLVFHMDDVRIQLIRSSARPTSNIARMVDWLRDYRGRVITSRAHPEFPCLEEFPLAQVLDRHPKGYFNSTAAYAVAYAIHEGVGKMTLFGMDFTYPDSHTAERGRACVEFWLGIAAAHGIELAMPQTSTLMDAMYPQQERFYGYDAVELDIGRDADGRIAVGFRERAQLPDADEIEARYDHRAHPNALVREGVEA